MSPEALEAAGTVTFEDLVPELVTVTLDGSADVRVEDEVPDMVLVEIGG